MNGVATSIVVVVAVEVGAHRIMGTANEWCCFINSRNRHKKVTRNSLKCIYNIFSMASGLVSIIFSVASGLVSVIFSVASGLVSIIFSVASGLVSFIFQE